MRQGAIRLFETKDASLNISYMFSFLRFLVGVSYMSGAASPATDMRMIAVHLGPICFTFTRFTRVEEPE